MLAPGLQLANAFGVLANAFGVLANAIGVLANAIGVLANAFGVNFKLRHYRNLWILASDVLVV